MKTSLVLLVCGLVATTLACFGGSGGGSSVSKAEKIALEAEKKVGSTLWSKESTRKIGSGTNKCNIFVAEMVEAAGATVPHRHSWSWTPIGAWEWGNPKSTYLVKSNCWKNIPNKLRGNLIMSSTRGDVIAFGGHVGIVTGNRQTTSASTLENRVVTNDWGFQVRQVPVFWRYTC